MKREFSTYDINEFMLIGRTDALTDSKKQIDLLLDEISPLYNKEGILERLKNYLLGYRIGTLERTLKEKGIHGEFDFITKSYLKENDECIKLKRTYDLYIEDAEVEAKLALQLR